MTESEETPPPTGEIRILTMEEKEKKKKKKEKKRKKEKRKDKKRKKEEAGPKRDPGHVVVQAFCSLQRTRGLPIWDNLEAIEVALNCIGM